MYIDHETRRCDACGKIISRFRCLTLNRALKTKQDRRLPGGKGLHLCFSCAARAIKKFCKEPLEEALKNLRGEE